MKEGSDNFEVTKQEVTVGVCARHYVFNAAPVNGHFDAAGPCPPLKRDEKVRDLVASKQARDDAKVAELISQGVQPIHTVYADGSGHPSFASIFSYASRPDALARGPIEVALDEGKPAKGRISPVVQMAAAKVNTATAKTAAANAAIKVADAAAATGTVKQTAKEAEKPSMFASLFGAKPKEPAPTTNEPSAPQSAAAPTPAESQR